MLLKADFMLSVLTRRREFLKTVLLGTSGAFAGPSFISRVFSAVQAGATRAPLTTRIPGTNFQIGGRVHEYLAGVTAQWLKVAPQSNPAMLEMFRDRDRHPLRDLEIGRAHV